MTRHIVPSQEVYHLWAQGNTNKGADGPAIWARNSSDSVSFSGKDAYSYRAIIGRIVERKGHGRAYLVSTRTWSVTTSGHQSMLRRAIGYDTPNVFHISNLGPDDSPSVHRERIADYLNGLAALALSQKRARKDYMREHYTTQIDEHIKEVRAYCAYFGLKVPKVETGALLVNLEEAKKAEAKRERERQAKAKRDLAKAAAEWRTGERQSMPYGYPDVMLRLRRMDDDKLRVETSRGAQVSYDVAERLYRAWSARTVQAGDAVNGYTVTRVNGDSSLQIGCHTITRAEAERFAISVGWTRADTAAA
jgi:hypothetical protein